MNTSSYNTSKKTRDLTYFFMWTVLIGLIEFIEAFEIHYLTLPFHMVPIFGIWILGLGGIYLSQHILHQKIQEKNKAVKNYIESETRYHSIIAAMAEGIVMHDATGNIVASNKSAENLLGLTKDQLYGRTSIAPCWHAIRENGQPFPGEEHPAMITLKTGEPQKNVIMGVHKPDDTLSWISINSQPIFHSNEKQPDAVVASFTDITIQKSIETELANQRIRAAQADRLQVLGELSAGVAHEINQPLGAISATAEGILLRYEHGMVLSQESINQSMQDILDMVERMSDTIHHLRIFSRDATQQENTPCSLNEAIQNSLKMMRTQLTNHNIEIVLELDENLPLISGHIQELEHIFINLLTNARDAIDEKSQTLSDTRNWQKQITIRSGYNPNSDTGIFSEIEDNGIGIPLDTSHHIFEPFYTTKPEDQGTGLGLAITYDIVKRHTGKISFESHSQNGTTFRIEFPMCPEGLEEV